MSRNQNIKRNMFFNILKHIIQLVSQFLIRTILIKTLGAEYIGLNGLFSNIFSFLNLAELGVGTAIVFSMYKPIVENDTEKIKALQNLYKKFYLIISLIVFATGILISPFLKFLINYEITVDVNIYILYALYLINTLFSYFLAHKRSLLFAYERNDVESIVKSICLLLMSVIQIIVLIIFKNYYIYFAITVVFTIIENVLILIVANKLYPQINGKSQPIDKETKKLIWKNVSALSMHKIGIIVISSTDNILISALFGIVLLGIYSNYVLILSSLVSLILILQNSIKASVGNLIASTDVNYVNHKFNVLDRGFSVFVAFCSICMFVLFQPFILYWTGSSSYLLDFSSVFLISLSFYLNEKRSCLHVFKDCAGIFWQDRWKPVFESVINLAVSIILGYFIGLNGIILGTIISLICVPLFVEPYVLYKHYFKKSMKEYFINYIFDFIISVVVCLISYFTCSLIPDGTLLLLIAKFATCGAITGILLIIIYLFNKDFRELIFTLKNEFFKKTRNKK